MRYDAAVSTFTQRLIGAARLDAATYEEVEADRSATGQALVVWFVGTRVLPEPQTQSDVGELLRTTGFAAAPGLVRVIGIVPFLAVPVAVVVAFWMLAAMVVAVRQALDYSGTGRALVVCGIGLLAYLGVNVAIGVVFGAIQALLGAVSVPV